MHWHWHPHPLTLRGNQVFPLLFSEFSGQIWLIWLPLQSGSRSGSSIHSQSNHWTSKASWTTLVPRGAVSSLWKTTTTKVSTVQPGLCHWSVTLGLLRWRVSIGSTAEAPCGGSCWMADKTLSVVSPLWRQGTGIVEHFASARVTEEECCQLSLDERVPTGFALTQIAHTVLWLGRETHGCWHERE